MTLFGSAQDFATVHAGTTKWDRMLAAIDNAGTIVEGVAHSIGDSLTYWRAASATFATEDFTGHRRYQSAFVVLDGDAQLEIAPKVELELAQAYSNLSDRESYTAVTGAWTPQTVTQGQILSVPIDCAWRVSPRSAAQLLLVRLTVEGATFHNK